MLWQLKPERSEGGRKEKRFLQGEIKKGLSSVSLNPMQYINDMNVYLYKNNVC
jgi:hypothetical protein